MTSFVQNACQAYVFCKTRGQCVGGLAYLPGAAPTENDIACLTATMAAQLTNRIRDKLEVVRAVEKKSQLPLEGICNFS